MTHTKVKTVGDGIFEEVIADVSPDLRKLTVATRALLAEIMPGITEVPWVRQRVVGYGIGPKKMTEHFCYIAPQSKHINLSFMYGAELDDPDGLLEGTGKLLRHIKIRSVDDLKVHAVRGLIEQASKHLPKL